MPEQAVGNVADALDALLVGSFAAAAFTGITTVQIFFYFKLYPSDKIGLKCLHFGVMAKAKALPWSLAVHREPLLSCQNRQQLTIIDTTILTIIVHCFFVYRIHILFKLSLPCGLILRYDGTDFNYCWWLDSNGFNHLGRSTIVIGGGYVQVTLCFWPAGMAIFEDGRLITVWTTSNPASLEPVFDWQILSEGSSLGAQIRSILVIPSTFAPGSNTPWDIAFSCASIPPADTWEASTQKDDPIPISYSEDGYMRASTTSLSKSNYSVFPKVAIPMMKTGLIMYRMRVNVSAGSETKVTLMGKNILRITGGGQTVQWDKWKAGVFTKLSDSSIEVGSERWTIVTLVYSSNSISLFENGVYKFNRIYDEGGSPWPATFSVQHWTAGTAVSVDISNVRCVPLQKNAEMLIRDLQPFVLAYYPLKTNLSEAIITAPMLSLIPVNNYAPKFTPGAFGNAIDFSAMQGALKFPLYPYQRTFASYTLALWVKVLDYPTTKAGIVGPLSILFDGKLNFVFQYSQTESYKRTTFTSRQAIPKNKWVSIIVAYAFEESRFSLFVDGVPDIVVYTSPDNSSQFATLPMYGFVGASEDNAGGITVLNGQVGDIMFFRQHVHDVTALALANKSTSADVPHERVMRFVPPLVPAFLSIAWAALNTAVVMDTVRAITSVPSLQDVVNRIVDRVGKPAEKDKRVSRQDIGIDENYPIHIDVDGEGPLDDHGLVSGFQDAINLNTADHVAVFRNGGPIPFLVQVRNNEYPFVDNFADKLTMFGSTLTATGADEMVRIIKPTGTIDFWINVTPEYNELPRADGTCAQVTCAHARSLQGQ
ncbi:hypothetical protein F5887DRAFT_1188517 [Amanita rubescens]|nr:hypothetical protein F5887DRAFT_1188517 [Amanita rubescens]